MLFLIISSKAYINIITKTFAFVIQNFTFKMGFLVNTNEFATMLNFFNILSNFKKFENNMDHMEVNKPKACFSNKKTFNIYR